jgi:hypothetical protein
VTKGATAYTSLKDALDAVNMSSAANGSSPNKYSTNNEASTANFSRELLRQVAHHAPARFAGIENVSTIQSVPLDVNDTISFKVSISAAENQHNLTSRSGPFDTRVYEIRLVLKADENVSNIAPVEADSGSQFPYHG